MLKKRQQQRETGTKSGIMTLTIGMKTVTIMETPIATTMVTATATTAGTMTTTAGNQQLSGMKLLSGMKQLNGMKVTGKLDTGVMKVTGM